MNGCSSSLPVGIEVIEYKRQNFTARVNIENFVVNLCGTITLKIDDSISDKFLWLLDHFSKDEVKILEQSSYVSDDEYLRGIEGMVQSIQEARSESIDQGLTLDKIDW